jgi:hypothetical protein
MHAFNLPLSKLDSPALWAALAPALSIASPALQRGASERDFGGERARLLDEGVALLGGVLSSGEAGVLASAVGALSDAGIPPVFLLVYEEAWAIARRLVPAARALIGPAELLADFWAWQVPPGHAGWPPHRGWYELVRNAGEPPKLLNVWVALTDVDANGACMMIVPLCEDPNYPSSLDRHDASLQSARALPAEAGTALAWDANALHWSARSSSRAPSRMSVSFTFRTLGGPAPETHAIDLKAHQDLRARLDLIAEQIVRYEDREASIPEPLREWARVNSALRARSVIARR